MSPIDFDTLLADYPEYAAEWRALRGWFHSNWRKRYVELPVLLRALPESNRRDLVFALDAMVESGMLATAYRIRSPGGDLLEGEYDEPDQIPEELWERDYSRKVSRGEGDLVSGLRWMSSDVA